MPKMRVYKKFSLESCSVVLWLGVRRWVNIISGGMKVSYCLPLLLLVARVTGLNEIRPSPSLQKSRSSELIPSLAKSSAMSLASAVSSRKVESFTPMPSATPPCSKWDGEYWIGNAFYSFTKMPILKERCQNVSEIITVYKRIFSAIPIAHYKKVKKVKTITKEICYNVTVGYSRNNTSRVQGHLASSTNSPESINHANGSGKDATANYEILRCTVWQIEAPACFNIYVELFNYDIEKSKDCEKDYMVVHDGPCSQVNGKICGKANNVTSFQSTSGKLQIKFVSDHDNTGRGFKGHYYFGRKPDCHHNEN